MSDSGQIPPQLAAQLDGLFSSIFAQSAAASWPKVNLALQISEAEALDGVKRDVTVVRHNECAACEGRGSSGNEQPVPCERCRGTGTTSKRQGEFTVASQCKACDGLGKLIIDPCGMCEGHGKVAGAPEVVAVVVPSGIANGTILRLSGAGSRRVDGSAGDVEIRVLVGEAEAANSDLMSQFVAATGLQTAPQRNLPQATVRGQRSLMPRKQTVMIYAVAAALIFAFVKFLQLLHVALPHSR